jgi:hypothetical protein
VVIGRVSFFSSDANVAAPNNNASKIDNFILFCSGGLRPSQICLP